MLEQAARIIAKIDHIALEPGTALFVEILDGLLQGGSCLFIEDTNVAHVIVGFIFYRIDVDDIAHNLDVEGFRNSLAHDGERDRRVGRSAHLADRIFKGEVLNIILINCGDNVSRLISAFAAGVSSIGATTLTALSSIVTSSPIPANSPVVWICNS